MNLLQIVEGLLALLKMVEKMSEQNLKTLVYGMIAFCGMWRLPEVIDSIRWW